MKTIKQPNDKRWQDYNIALDELEADPNLEFINKFPVTKACLHPLSANNEMIEERIGLILGECSIKAKNVIEFGAGYGNFCKHYKEKVPESSYTIVDNPSMTKFAKVFLDKFSMKSRFVDTKNALSIDDNFDLMVAFSSISETPREYRAQILEHFVPKSDTVIFGEAAHEPWTLPIISKYFIEANCTALNRQRNHWLFIGTTPRDNPLTDADAIELAKERFALLPQHSTLYHLWSSIVRARVGAEYDKGSSPFTGISRSGDLMLHPQDAPGVDILINIAHSKTYPATLELGDNAIEFQVELDQEMLNYALSEPLENLIQIKPAGA